MLQNIIVAFHRCSLGMLLKETQKQPCRDVLRKRCSENMKQIYSRTPMPKCDFKSNFSLDFFKKNKQTNICNRFKKCKICFLDFLEEQAVLESLFNKEHLRMTAPDADSDQVNDVSS